LTIAGGGTRGARAAVDFDDAEVASRRVLTASAPELIPLLLGFFRLGFFLPLACV
jgi:hypothetical protein